MKHLTALIFAIILAGCDSEPKMAERIERACIGGDAECKTACVSSPCVVARESSAWLLGVTRHSQGVYTLNVAPGVFAEIPSCIVQGSGNVFAQIGHAALSSTSIPVAIKTVTATPAPYDLAFDIICMGKR